jgi:hypothetical protein
VRTVERAIAVTIFLLVLWCGCGSALAQTSGPSPSPSGPVLPATGTSISLVVGAAVLLILAWFVPLWIDARRAARMQRHAWDSILRRLDGGGEEAGRALPVDDLIKVLPYGLQPPQGISGLSRVLLAFIVTSIVAILALAMLFSSAVGVFDVVKQIVTAVLGVFATIIGFYFGARTAEGVSSPASTSGASSSTPPPGTPESDTGAEAAPSQTFPSTQQLA